MSITTLAELRTAIQNLFDDSAELASARIDEHLALCEAAIRRRVRCRELEASSDLTVSSQTVALPTRFLRVRRIYLAGDPKRRLRPLWPTNFWLRYLGSDTAEPSAFTVEGENFVFGPSPDQTYTGKLLFYQWVGGLSASNVPTLFTNHPDLYLYGTAIHSADYLEDNQKVLKYAAKFDGIIEEIHSADALDRAGEEPLEALSDVFGL